MNLFDLEAFVAVVDHGSIVAASAVLHLTQSAVTRRIQNLENSLAVPLLDRQNRPLQPTRAGRETYEFAKPVLSSVSDLKTAIVHNGEPAGDFRFGVSRSLGDLALTHAIGQVREGYHRLRLQAFAQWSCTLLERLVSRTLDAAVVLLPEDSAPPDSVDGEQLGTATFSIVAAKSNRLPRSLRLKDISSSPWILNPHGCGVRSMLETALRHQSLPLAIAVEAEGNDLQLSLVAQNVGFAFVMPHVYDSSPFRKHLRIVNIKDFAPQQSVWALHSRHIGHLFPVVHCLKDAIAQYLQNRRPKRDRLQ
jgi:DNA-binding transcriptional LysR family regulator